LAYKWGAAKNGKQEARCWDPENDVPSSCWLQRKGQKKFKGYRSKEIRKEKKKEDGDKNPPRAASGAGKTRSQGVKEGINYNGMALNRKVLEISSKKLGRGGQNCGPPNKRTLRVNALSSNASDCGNWERKEEGGERK